MSQKTIDDLDLNKERFVRGWCKCGHFSLFHGVYGCRITFQRRGQVFVCMCKQYVKDKRRQWH